MLPGGGQLKGANGGGVSPGGGGLLKMNCGGGEGGGWPTTPPGGGGLLRPKGGGGLAHASCGVLPPENDCDVAGLATMMVEPQGMLKYET